MFDPSMFPRAKSTLRFNADITPTTSSGNEVPKATIDIPTTDSGIFNCFAILIAEPTNNLDP